jgi:hypothetical protein
MNGNIIINVKDPSNDKDAVNKKYIDNQLEKYIKLETDIDMKGKRITNVQDAAEPQDVINKKYIDTQLEKYLKADTDINMSNKRITNLSYPSSSNDAATKNFVDVEIAKLHLSIPKAPTIPIPVVRIFGFQLPVGPCEKSWRADNFNITIKDLRHLKPTKNNTVVQITPLLETMEYHDGIFCNIRQYKFLDDKFIIDINTCRSDDTHWGLYIKINLTLFVFQNVVHGTNIGV